MVVNFDVNSNTQNIFAWKIGVLPFFGGQINFSIPMYGVVLSATVTSGSATAKANINVLLSNYKWNIYKSYIAGSTGVFFTSTAANGTLISPTVTYTKTATGSGSFDASLYMGHLTGSFSPITEDEFAEYTIYFYGTTTITATRTVAPIQFEANCRSGVNATVGGAFGSATNGTLTYLPATFPTFVASSLTVITPTVSSGTILGNILKGTKLEVNQVVLPTGTSTLKLGSNSTIFDNAGTLSLRAASGASNTFTLNTSGLLNGNSLNLTGDLFCAFNGGQGSGVWMINGNSINTALEAIIPLFCSQSNLGNINNQGSITAVSVSGAVVGSLISNFTLNNLIDVIILFPRWGVIGYDGTGYTSTIRINLHNDQATPIFVQTTSANTLSSCRIYYNRAERTGLGS